MANPRNGHVMQEILTRAAVDEEFRAALKSDPHAALDAQGCVLPPDFRIKFVEKDPDVDVLFVLPDSIDTNRELSPEDLDAVAGGDGFVPPNDLKCWEW